MARPSKHTPELQAALVEVFRVGQTSIEAACQYVGIAPSTFYEWMKTKPEFAEAIQKARSEAVLGYLAVIRKAAQSGQWQAAAWWLERVLPAEYGRRSQVEVITIDLVEREIARLEAELAEAELVGDG
jgi:transposase-like protein